VSYSNQEIREKYGRFARWYDIVEGILTTLLGVNRLRRRLLTQTRGRVLEVAAGTGLNLRFYPAAVHPVLLDLSGEMLAVAQCRISNRGHRASLVQANAEHLPFPSGLFDAVVSTLSLCTFPEPESALREFARVCSPEGVILLLEHGASRVRWLARFQDRRAESHAKPLGCYWNRRPDEMVMRAGLHVLSESRSHAGIFYSFALAPDTVHQRV
jgi:ubiquinone/menaquinone biosynthesis C-methylase UbiE